MAEKDEDDLNVAGRLHDGWAYALTLRGGKIDRVADHDKLTVVLTRLREARASLDENGVDSIQFSGARMSGEDENGRTIIEKPDGKGSYLAHEIVGIRYWGPGVETFSEQAVDTARALLEIQNVAMSQVLAERGMPVEEEEHAPAPTLLGGR